MKITLPFAAFCDSVSMFSKQHESKAKNAHNSIQFLIPADATDTVTLRSKAVTGAMRSYLKGATIDRTNLDDDSDGEEITDEVIFNLAEEKVKELIQLGGETEVSYTDTVTLELTFNMEEAVTEVKAILHDVGKGDGEDADYTNDVVRTYTVPRQNKSDNRDLSFEIPEEDTTQLPVSSLLTILDLLKGKVAESGGVGGKNIYFGESFAMVHTARPTFFVRNLLHEHISKVTLVRTTAETLYAVVRYHVANELESSEVDEDGEPTVDIEGMTISAVITPTGMYIRTGSIEVKILFGKDRHGATNEAVIKDFVKDSEFRFRGAVLKQGLNRTNLLSGKSNDVSATLTPTSCTLSLQDFSVPVEVIDSEGASEKTFKTTPELLKDSILSDDPEIIFQLGHRGQTSLLVTTSSAGLPDDLVVGDRDRVWYTVNRIAESN